MSKRASGFLLVFAAATLWSTSGLFIRWTVAGSGASALSLAFWRDLATFVSLLVGLALFRPAWLRVARRDLPWLAALGAVGVGTFHVLWNLTILRLGYGVATILLYTSPAFVAVMARLLWGEPLTRFKGLAVALTLAGCILMTGREELVGSALTVGGLLLGLSAALAYGSFNLFGRQVARRYPPWTVLVYGFGFGALALLPFQFRAALPWPLATQTWAWFAGLVLIATLIPFGLYMAALRRLPVSIASILATSEILLGALVGYFLFGERLGGWQILGGILVVSGVAIIALRS